MSDTDTIDYRVAFEELTLLNKLFSKHTETHPPRLNYQQFEQVSNKDLPFDTYIYRSVRTGIYYSTFREQNYPGEGWRYAAFTIVRPTERTVIEWIEA